MQMTLVKVYNPKYCFTVVLTAQCFVSLVASDAHIACLSSEGVYVLSKDKQKLTLNWFCVTLAKESYILLFDVFWHMVLSLFANNPPRDTRQNSKLILCIKKMTTLNTFITGAVTKCILQSQEKASV